ncbi:MAG: hypothetical protein WCV80_00340 [Candidatus Paceibacterota bacterium]|jgi:hypothetical protein
MDPAIFLTSISTFISHLLVSGPWLRIYTIAHFIFLILDTALVVGIILFTIHAYATRRKIDIHAAPPSVAQILKKPGLQAAYKESWEKILARAVSSPPDSYRAALMDADALIDQLLQDAGFVGTNMAERLGRLNNMGLRSLNAVFRAHRIRNELAHSSDVILLEKEMREVINLYEKFLHEVKIL